MPRKGYRSLTLRDDVYRKVLYLAEQEGISPGQYLERALVPYEKYRTDFAFESKGGQRSFGQSFLLKKRLMAGPLGFEPRTSGSAGLRPRKTVTSARSAS